MVSYHEKSSILLKTHEESLRRRGLARGEVLHVVPLLVREADVHARHAQAVADLVAAAPRFRGVHDPAGAAVSYE